MTENQKQNIFEATEMLNLYNQCWKKIDFLAEIKHTYGDMKISEVIESLENQALKFNNKFRTLIKE